MSLLLDDIGFSYGEGDFGISIPRLEIQKGESVALVGPSGCGKTTLLNIVAGILTPTRGQAYLDGSELTRLGFSARRRHRLSNIGMIFQSFELLEYLNVRDNVLLQARLSPEHRLGPELEHKALGIAQELGLADKWQSRITALSQGERQRVAGCRALLLNPALVLADEPTGNLDPDNKRVVLNQLIDMCRRDQRVLLTVTHDHSLLPAFDRVLDMADLCQGERALT